MYRNNYNKHYNYTEQTIFAKVLHVVHYSNHFYIPDTSVCYGFSGNVTNSSSVTVTQPRAHQDPYGAGRYPEGTTIQYKCNNGYAPIGDHTQVTCGSDGAWKPSPPSCARE